MKVYQHKQLIGRSNSALSSISTCSGGTSPKDGFDRRSASKMSLSTSSSEGRFTCKGSCIPAQCYWPLPESLHDEEPPHQVPTSKCTRLDAFKVISLGEELAEAVPHLANVSEAALPTERMSTPTEHAMDAAQLMTRIGHSCPAARSEEVTVADDEVSPETCEAGAISSQPQAERDAHGLNASQEQDTHHERNFSKSSSFFQHWLRPGSRTQAGGESSNSSQTSEGVIIFDWDDTLLPTTYIRRVIMPTLDLEEDEDPFREESPYFGQLVEHAKVLENLLRTARKIAHVAIVTLASAVWVEASAAHFLPGLDFAALCEELDIVVYPAERPSSTKPYVLSGKDAGVHAKRLAMDKCLNSYYKEKECLWNVISVGDSVIEKDALHGCLGTWNLPPGQKALCKTVKFPEMLTPTALTKELQLLATDVVDLVNHKHSVDKTMGNVCLTTSVMRSLGL